MERTNSTSGLQPHQLVRRTVALVLAGGRGSRLKQLTDKRAKPAVYFGGKFRIIDFALSNCVNSGIRRIGVVTQYKSHSLLRHLQRGWSFLRAELNEIVDLLPAQQRIDEEHWYRGTADAVFQNLDIIQSLAARVHRRAGRRPRLQDGLLADAAKTMSSTAPAARWAASKCRAPRPAAFGVMAVDDSRKITSFVEKPADPPPMPGKPDVALASMGIYVFDADYLYKLLDEDLANPASSHDFGKDVIPRAVAEGRALAHPFGMSCIANPNGAPPYWRDVGTIDAFWSANLDLASINPELDIYDTDWPIWTYQRQLPPAKFIPDRNGSHGMTVNTHRLRRLHRQRARMSPTRSSSRTCACDSFCNIDQAVVLPDVTIERSCRLRKVVIDRGCVLPEGLVVGEDAAADAARFERTEGGVVPDHARHAGQAL